MVRQRRPDIGIKKTIGLYEFALVPRSMFAPDGSICCIILQKVLSWPYWRSSHQDRLTKEEVIEPQQIQLEPI